VIILSSERLAEGSMKFVSDPALLLVSNKHACKAPLGPESTEGTEAQTLCSGPRPLRGLESSDRVPEELFDERSSGSACSSTSEERELAIDEKSTGSLMSEG
jgi:hypothetical protein